jgi:hypothetical protein
VARQKFLRKIGKLSNHRLARQAFLKAGQKIVTCSDAKFRQLISQRMISESVQLMTTSHSERALRLCTGSLHRILEKPGVRRQCLAKWIIGATDVWEDIFKMPNLYADTDMVCRLCKEEISVETKAHLLIDCEKTQDLRDSLYEQIDQEAIIQLNGDRQEEEIILSILSAFETPTPLGQEKRIKQVQHGFSIKNVLDVIRFEQESPDSIKICINARGARNGHNTIAWEIFSGSRSLIKECFSVSTDDTNEACMVAATAAIGLIINDVQKKQGHTMPGRIHSLCMNPGFADSLQRIHSPIGKWAKRDLVDMIGRLSEDVNVYAHYLSSSIHIDMPEVYYSTYSHAVESHLHPSNHYMGEIKRSKRFHRNVDRVATFIFEINQRLPTREAMRSFQGYRRICHKRARQKRAHDDRMAKRPRRATRETGKTHDS